MRGMKRWILLLLLAAFTVGTGCLNSSLPAGSSDPGPENRSPVPEDLSPTRDARCPRCGNTGVPIIYGKPGKKLIEKAMRKEVYLGGCIVREHAPSFHCFNCDLDY